MRLWHMQGTVVTTSTIGSHFHKACKLFCLFYVQIDMLIPWFHFDPGCKWFYRPYESDHPLINDRLCVTYGMIYKIEPKNLNKTLQLTRFSRFYCLSKGKSIECYIVKLIITKTLLCLTSYSTYRPFSEPVYNWTKFILVQQIYCTFPVVNH